MLRLISVACNCKPSSIRWEGRGGERSFSGRFFIFFCGKKHLVVVFWSPQLLFHVLLSLLLRTIHTKVDKSGGLFVRASQAVAILDECAIQREKKQTI